MGIIKEIQSDLDNAALRVVSDYRSRLSAEALKLCGNPTDSEDLVMRTFDAVFRARDTFDSKKGDFYPWIVGVMHRVWAKTDRRIVDRATQPVDPLILNDLAGASNKTMEDILRNSDHDALRAAINHLEPEYRKLIGLYYFDDLSLKEIAAFLKTSPSSISRKLEVARKILMAKLSVQLGKKKPLAVLLGVLLGAGALFGAWQAGEAIIEAMKPPTAENNQIPLTTTKEKSKMNTLKRITLAATAAASVMSMSAPAEIVLGEKTDNDYGWTRTYTEDGKEYVVTAYTKPGSGYEFEVPANVNYIDYLVIGGGGSGGYASYGGGGGAGGMLEGYGVQVTPLSKLSITVGAGGVKANTKNDPGNNGSESILTGIGEEAITAYGGGGGGGRGNWDGKDGGSGGGAGGYEAGHLGGTGKQGYAGAVGRSINGKKCGGGGGGAGGTPTEEDCVNGGSYYYCLGGPGKACVITGEEVIYAQGGNSAYYKGLVALTEETPGSGGCAAEAGGTPSGTLGYSDAKPGSDGIVVIRYAKVSSVQLTVTPNTGTQVSLNGRSFVDKIEESLPSDSPVTLTAKGASDAFEFEWGNLPAGAEVSADTKTVTFNMPGSDWAITVTGKATTLWKLEVSQTEGGTVAGTESGNYPDGTVVDLTATPNENYKFLGWYIGDHCEEESEHLTFALERDTSLVAKFEEKAKYTLTITPSDYGKITGNEGTEFYDGTKVTLTATPNEGLVFVGWGNDAAPFGKATEITLTMDAAKTVSAKFGYTLTITPSEYGAIVPEPNGTVFEAGATVMLTATPNENCEFLSWQGDVTGDGATTTVTMDQDRTVAALYKDNKGRAHYEWGWKGEVKNDKGRVTGYIVAYEKPGKYDLEVPKGSTIDYLVVAGGGSGGFATYGGGGGAGGMIYETGVAVSSKTLSITVGKGGDVQTTEHRQGNNGENSSISNGVTQIALAYGGGGGGGRNSGDGNPVGKDGGSGGGGGYDCAKGGKGTEGQGCDGADCEKDEHSTQGAGGGGGAGGKPKIEHFGSSDANPGGPGRSCGITGEDVVYAVGGASAPNKNGSAQTSITAGSGSNAFGSNALESQKKPGCDGIVVIRYAARKSGLAIMFY